MMQNHIRLVAICCSLSTVIFIIGCGKSDTASTGTAPDATTTPASSDAGAVTGTKKTGGAVPDTNVMPAPGGVKTGIDGGKK